MIADGKAVAKILEEKLKEKLANVPPKEVCFVLFGNNADSRQFITMKSTVAQRLGIAVNVLQYAATTKTAEAVEIIHTLVGKNYSGIVVQLPLPPGLDRKEILNSVPFPLDIDVLSDKAKQAYVSKTSTKVPPVARAVMEILNFYHVDLANRQILIVGKGALVGEPIAMMFSGLGLPFQIVDEHTGQEEKMERMRSADIIISGVGSPHMIQPEMVKDGVVLIDAGTSEQSGKFVGDIDPACAEKASLFTPVPGGVGPVTVISLFLNMQ